MTNFMAQPDGYEIKVGHNIFEEGSANYFRVTAKKNFEVSKSQALSVGQKVSSIQLTELKSSESEIYYVENVILNNKTKLWMQFRDKNLFGTNTDTNLTFDMSNIVSPFNLNQWMYNYTPTMDIEEDANLAVTSSTSFNGIIFTIHKYNRGNEKDGKIIEKIKEGKERCWHVRG